MEDQRTQDFDTLIEAAAGLPRPKLPYAELPTDALLSVHFYLQLIVCQLSYMILLRASGAKDVDEVVRWSRELSWERLREVYAVYPRLDLFVMLADMKMEEPIIGAEIVRRLELADRPVTKAFIELDWVRDDDVDEDKARTQKLLRLLKVDYLSTHREWDQTNEELRLNALEAGLEAWRQWDPVRPRTDALLPFMIPPVQMLPAELAFWKGPMARAWQQGCATFHSEMLPILTGKKESLATKTRDHLRQEWGIASNRLKICEEHGYTIAQEMESSPAPAPDAVLESKENQESNHLYLNVLARFGADKGRRLVDALSAGKTHKQACRLAGISRKSFYKYTKSLKV